MSAPIEEETMSHTVEIVSTEQEFEELCDFRDHFIVYGWDRFSRHLTEELYHSDTGTDVVAVLEDEARAEEVKDHFDHLSEKKNCNLYLCVTPLRKYENLERLELGRALSILINVSDDEEALMTVIRLQDRMRGEIPNFIVEISDENLNRTFRNAGVQYVISRENIAAHVVASHIYETDVADYVEDLFRATRNGRDYDIQQYQLAENCELLRELDEPRYDEAFHYLRKEEDTMVIGVAQKDGDLQKLPDRNTPLEPGDWLVVVTNGAQQSELESLFGNSQGLLSETSREPSDEPESQSTPSREPSVPN